MASDSAQIQASPDVDPFEQVAADFCGESSAAS
jgi:hypothetical protein